MTQEDDRPDASETQPSSGDSKKNQPASGQITLGSKPETGASGLPLLRLGPEHAPAKPETSEADGPEPLGSEAELSAKPEEDTEKNMPDPPATEVPEGGDPETEGSAKPPEAAPQPSPEPENEPAITDSDTAETLPPEEGLVTASGADPWSVREDVASPVEAEPELDSQPPAPTMAAASRPDCAAALFGKLPTRGDFIARNMPRLLQRPFEDWLIPLVQQTRTDLGAHWTDHWRNAGPWRFWIGPDVLGGSWQHDLRKPAHQQSAQGGAVTGVLLPSADRHGRDFPLVVVLADALARLMPPPVTSSPDRGWYDLCDELLYAARAGTDIAAVEAALDALPGPLLPEGAEDMEALLGQRALWAQGTEVLDDGTSRIWRDISTADHHLAASSRSYWWQAPRAGAAQRVLSLAGLPDAGSFAFMLAQGHPDAPAPQT